MGYITVQVGGSFRTKSTEKFGAMRHGHAHAVSEAIEYLVTEVLPEAINQDHQLHEGGTKPSGGFTKISELVALGEVLADAVSIDGGHHKQWYLEHIAGTLGIDLPDHEPGIAP